VVGGMSRRGGGGAEDVVQGGPVLGRQAVVEFRFEDFRQAPASGFQGWMTISGFMRSTQGTRGIGARGKGRVTPYPKEGERRSAPPPSPPWGGGMYLV